MQMEINKLENENTELKSSLQLQNMKNFTLESEFNELKSKCELVQTNSILNEEKVDLLQAEKENIIKVYEGKISKFSGFKQKASELKNTLDKMLIKMSSIKNFFIKFQKEKADLLEERHNLVIRAAAGFENLTPRPNYNNLCSEKNLNFSNLMQKTEKKKKQTTFLVVDTLLNKICEYQAKIAFLENELKERKRFDPNKQPNMRPSQSPQKNSVNPRITGSISPVKSSKMYTLENGVKKSRMVAINVDDDGKSVKSRESFYGSAEKKEADIFDFKTTIEQEEAITKEIEKEQVKETEIIIAEIIESKKMIDQFDLIK